MKASQALDLATGLQLFNAVNSSCFHTPLQELLQPALQAGTGRGTAGGGGPSGPNLGGGVQEALSRTSLRSRLRQAQRELQDQEVWPPLEMEAAVSGGGPAPTPREQQH